VETRTVTVDASTVSDAREAAIAALRANGFDPLRILSSRCIGFVRFEPDATAFAGTFRYEVQVSGDLLEENMARALWGDR
jgi:hypothetical protein